MSTDYNKLAGRDLLADEIAQELIQSYRFVTLIMGPSGCGKTYVINEILKKLFENNRFLIYTFCGDRLVPMKYNGNISLNGIDVSFGTALFSAGIGVSWQKESMIDSFVDKILAQRRKLSKKILIYIDGYETATREVKEILNFIFVSAKVKKKSKDIYFLISGRGGVFFPQTSTFSFTLVAYDENDLREYINKKIDTARIENLDQKLSTLHRLTGGDFNLVNLVISDLMKPLSYFDSMQKIIRLKLDELIKSSSSNLSYLDLEDIILSAALSLNKFSTSATAIITERTNNEIYNAFKLAQSSQILSKDDGYLYSFTSETLRDLLSQLSKEERKERLFQYYLYITEKEPDNYFLRAHYLVLFSDSVTPQAFCLLVLSYLFSQRMYDTNAQLRVEELLLQKGTKEQIEDFTRVKIFSNKLMDPDMIELDLQQDFTLIKNCDFEIPLFAELTCMYFHWLYTHTAMNGKQHEQIYNRCKALVDLDITLSPMAIPDNFESKSEEIIKLSLIYELMPYVLDKQNDHDTFNVLMFKLNSIICSTKNTGIHSASQYLKNVFNRKASLYVNPMQCSIYYEEAKRYFKKLEAWTEYCITKISEAGTCIVTQEFDEAISLCQSALETAKKKGIVIPKIAKLYNNLAIASFLKIESTNESSQDRVQAAQECIKSLQISLSDRPCATEFVLLTNICSLSLYIDDDGAYCEYKQCLQSMLKCKELSDLTDTDVNDFYRYFFSWFELYREVKEQKWGVALKRLNSLKGFVPTLFKKQEQFWQIKFENAKNIIAAQKEISAIEFCHAISKTKRRETALSKFYCRGLMLSDLQYTSI